VTDFREQILLFAISFASFIFRDGDGRPPVLAATSGLSAGMIVVTAVVGHDELYTVKGVVVVAIVVVAGDTEEDL